MVRIHVGQPLFWGQWGHSLFLSKKNRRGGDFHNFLKEQGILGEVEARALKNVLSLQLKILQNMNLTNDSYVILIKTKRSAERYYRDKAGWVKKSARGRKFRATAEQVLNHLLPVLAGLKPNLIVEVKHRPAPKKRSV